MLSQDEDMNIPGATHDTVDTAKAYAGIGARATPAAMLALMQAIGQVLAQDGYLLRSGGAQGADSAFAQGALEGGGNRRIYLPWPAFNGVRDDDAVVFDRLPGADQAARIAAQFHHRWDSLKWPVRKLMARNVMQVLGDDCQTPCKFVICWAPGTQVDARGRVCDVAGGTGQAVRIAYAHKIPVFNLALPDHAHRLRQYCKSREAGTPFNSSGAGNMLG